MTVRSSRCLPAVLAAAIGVACIPGMRQSYRFPTEVAQATLPADGVRELRVAAGTGDVHVMGEAGREQVDVTVRLRSQDAERLERVCIPSARLESKTDLGTMELRLRQDDRNKCGESWEVRVPARLATTLTGDVTRFRAEGAFESLNITASGPGRVDGAFTAEGVSVDLGHGPVDLTVTTADFDAVEVRSDNGGADLSLDGASISAQRSPPGARASLDGDGRGDIRARSRLGDVRLRLIRPR